MGRQPEIEEPGFAVFCGHGAAGVEAYRKYWRTALSLVVKNAKNVDTVSGRKSHTRGRAAPAAVRGTGQSDSPFGPRNSAPEIRPPLRGFRPTRGFNSCCRGLLAEPHNLRTEIA